MNAAEIIERAKTIQGDKIADSATEKVIDPYIELTPEHLVEVMTFLRDDDELDMDLLSCLTAVDYPKDNKIELIYNVESIGKKHELTVKVKLDRDKASCPTLEDVWRTADWHEREAWDLMGVTFEGHHNLVRILCAEDWEGHPLRKDYEMPKYYHGIPNDYDMFYDVQNP